MHNHVTSEGTAHMTSSSVATGSAKSKIIILPGQVLPCSFGCNNTDKVAIKEKLERKQRCRIQLQEHLDAVEEKRKNYRSYCKVERVKNHVSTRIGHHTTESSRNSYVKHALGHHSENNVFDAACLNKRHGNIGSTLHRVRRTYCSIAIDFPRYDNKIWKNRIVYIKERGGCMKCEFVTWYAWPGGEVVIIA